MLYVICLSSQITTANIVKQIFTGVMYDLVSVMLHKEFEIIPRGETHSQINIAFVIYIYTNSHIPTIAALRDIVVFFYLTIQINMCQILKQIFSILKWIFLH